MKIRKVIKM